MAGHWPPPLPLYPPLQGQCLVLGPLISPHSLETSWCYIPSLYWWLPAWYFHAGSLLWNLLSSIQPSTLFDCLKSISELIFPKQNSCDLFGTIRFGSPIMFPISVRNIHPFGTCSSPKISDFTSNFCRVRVFLSVPKRGPSEKSLIPLKKDWVPEAPQIFLLVFPKGKVATYLPGTVHYGNGNTQTFLGLLKTGSEVGPIPKNPKCQCGLPHPTLWGPLEVGW